MLQVFALLLMTAACLFAGQLERLGPAARLRFASFSGGVASAYVFLFILPKLADQQQILEQAVSGWALLDYLYHHAYLVALAGFASYYLANMISYLKIADAPFDDRGKLGVFMLALYAGLLGEMSAAQIATHGAPGLLLTLALFIHLLGLNYLLSNHFSHAWPWLRWILAASLCLGWLLGALLNLPYAGNALLSAWMAGSIIIHVVIIELPQERRSWAFVIGILVFVVLLKLYLDIEGIEGGV